MSQQQTVSINVPVLARVEGEGALDLTIHNGEIETLHLRIFEPPRFFEKFVEGRDYSEVPDLVARICGICPVAYQMSAVHAFEEIFELKLTPWIRDLRRLLYCGEWLESHNLHIHLLAAPDFLGYSSAPEMAKDYPEIVRRGMYLQEIGNSIVKVLGGRSVHPIGVKVGGFHRAPSLQQMTELLGKLEAALPIAEKLVTWTTTLKLPIHPQNFTSVALHHPDEYPMNEGRLISSAGLDISIQEYDDYFQEFHVPHSTALHSHLQGKPYLLGPLARLNLNFAQLPEAVKARVNVNGGGVTFPSNNMYDSMVARAVEVHYAIHEAIRILKNYHLPDSPAVPVKVKAGVGFGCTEAPRGMLWHRWEVNATGQVTASRIVPPTSQNQARIEEDLRTALQQLGLDNPPETLRMRAETVIRNYDPCISCATHFLKINVNQV